MKQIDDFEYVFHKKVSENITDELSIVLKKLGKIIEKMSEKVNLLNQKINVITNISKINELSSEVNTLNEELLKICVIKNRIELIFNRNVERKDYLNKKLSDAGIYIDKLDKKRFDETKKAYIEKVDEKSLNLNQKNSENNVVLKNINGTLLTFVNDKLDLSVKSNIEVLSDADENYVFNVIYNNPESVKTILPKDLVDTTFKKKILKVIASISMGDNVSSIKQLNEQFGNLLSFKTEIPKDAESYVTGVQNLFNFMVKQELIKQNPDKTEIINKKLKCNSKSELIPASIKKIAFASGLAGEDEYSEENESEEIRKDKQKEIDKDIFAAFELELSKIEAEIEEEKNKDLEKEEEIIRQKHIEEQEKESEAQMLKKHDDD